MPGQIVDNLRTGVTDALKPLLPEAWQIIPFSKNLDTITRPVVMLQLEEVQRHKDAPNGARLVTYTLTVIEPKTDPGPADDSLEANLIDLLNAIDKSPGLAWSGAKRVVAHESNPAFDITLTYSVANAPLTEGA